MRTKEQQDEAIRSTGLAMAAAVAVLETCSTKEGLPPESAALVKKLLIKAMASAVSALPPKQP